MSNCGLLIDAFGVSDYVMSADWKFGEAIGEI
jgi:hypothetical protein